MTVNTGEITTAETVAAIRLLKNKMPGPDTVPAKMLKYRVHPVVEHLTVLQNVCRTTGRVPEDWQWGGVGKGCNHQTPRKKETTPIATIGEGLRFYLSPERSSVSSSWDGCNRGWMRCSEKVRTVVQWTNLHVTQRCKIKPGILAVLINHLNWFCPGIRLRTPKFIVVHKSWLRHSRALRRRLSELLPRV